MIIQGICLSRPAISCHPKHGSSTPCHKLSSKALGTHALSSAVVHSTGFLNLSLAVIHSSRLTYTVICSHQLLFTARDSRILPSAVTTGRCSQTLSSACYQLSSTTGRCSQPDTVISMSSAVVYHRSLLPYPHATQLLWCCHITMDPETTTHHDRIWSYNLYVYKETNIV